MATSNQSKSSNLFKIIWEALIFLIKNWQILLIFVPLYFINFLLSIFKSLSVNPILTKLLQNITSLSKLKPPNPDFYQIFSEILTELREITILEIIFFVTIFLFSTLLSTSTLCSICMTYTDKKQPTLKELFSKFKKTWKGTMITQFYATIFTNMFVPLIFLLTVGLALFSMNSAGFYVLSFILLISAVILNLYLAMIWLLSVVVSVEDEEGIYGLAAIVKATEMMKGRRWKGISINIFITSSMVAYMLPLMDPSLSGMKKLAIIGVFFAVAAVMNVFDLVVAVVFYFECKKGDGELMMMKKNQSGFGYSSLPSEALADSENP
ncbi:uncharacterized protein LOC110100317 [Dendrobium catenatum]|uniref:Uncharacterized protein n=1 Tax=Dendrobium catenatum TaxID=906689 RepID=A0A2I0W0B8_9ASPA|nr:uncharacterized protein LOC110100317 [Dendrobium catenatum]PKU69100.1 hypothetical protein MA16_Dca002370 [Dendrobium catenatum]